MSRHQSRAQFSGLRQRQNIPRVPMRIQAFCLFWSQNCYQLFVLQGHGAMLGSSAFMRRLFSLCINYCDSWPPRRNFGICMRLLGGGGRGGGGGGAIETQL